MPSPRAPTTFRFNRFFFGDFVRMDCAAFHDAMAAVMNDPSRTYAMQVREVAFIAWLAASAALVVVARFG